MSDGDTPGIREASAILRGLRLVSFIRASIDNDSKAE